MSYDSEIDSLPPPLQDIVERELEPDENLIWIGQPIPVYFTASSTAATLFAIPWTLFALFWICGAAGFKIPPVGPEMLFPLFGVPFVLIGLAMFCSPLYMYRSLKKTVYAITDQRAIVFAGTFRATKIESFAPNELGKLQRTEKANGIGDVIFQKTSLAAVAEQGTELVSTNGFLNIPHVKEVERLLKDLAAQAPPEITPEEEQTQLADLPQLQLIGEAPRFLPLSTRLYLRLCSGAMPLFGWCFAVIGLIAVLAGVAAPMQDGDWTGKLMFIGIGSLFGIIGFSFPIYSWFTGGKAIHLLQDGIAVGAKYIGMSRTGTEINDRPVMKIDFAYQVDGETYTASAKALDTSRLTDSKHKVVLFDPMEPKRSVVLDGLPSGIHFDEMTGQFQGNVLACVLPLFASVIVGAEIVAIIVFAIKAI